MEWHGTVIDGPQKLFQILDYVVYLLNYSVSKAKVGPNFLLFHQYGLIGEFFIACKNYGRVRQSV